jgi:predicted DNA-binding transcriptional regulator AlpA
MSAADRGEYHHRLHAPLINRPTTSLVHGLVSSIPHTQIEQSAASWHRPISARCQGASHLPSTKIDPQMSPHMRVLSFGELKSLKHIGWNEEYIAQLVGAGLFPAPIHPGTWRESHIDDWLRTRKAKGDLSWMRFSLKEVARPIARVGRHD